MAELFREFYWLIFPIGGMGIGVFAIWMAHNSKRRTLDLIRIYAEQGKEPPQALIDALSADPDRAVDRIRAEKGFHKDYSPFTRNPVALWSRFVLMAALAIGFGGTAFWLSDKPGTETIVFGFTITAFVLAAVAASALVRALLAPHYDGKE